MAFMSDAFDDLLRLQGELDNLLRKPSQGFLPGPSSAGVFPPVNVFRGPQGMMIRAEMPGINPADIDVSIEGRQITISGERTPDAAARGGYHRRERAWGKFSRSIRLPDDVDPAQAKAECRDGILTVRLPLHEAAKPRQITVQGS